MLRKTIVKLSIFFALLIIADLVIGFSVRKIYFMQNHGAFYRTTNVLEKATPQIMILGSSKAAHHYIPALITDSTDYTCYNGGRDGSFISYSNAAVNSILKRYKPKIILLDILDDEFEQRSYKIADKLSVLLPYYKTHPEIRDIIDLKSPFEKYKLVSGMYTFNTLLLPSITGALDLSNKKDEEKTQGYLPMNEKWNGEMKIVDSRNEKLDTNKINGLKNIISACKQHNIRLVIIVSPTYKKYVQNYSPTIELTCKIADSSRMPFWNYLEDTTFLNHKYYFQDIRHMNNDGAVVFTTDIIKKLKQIK